MLQRPSAFMCGLSQAKVVLQNWFAKLSPSWKSTKSEMRVKYLGLVLGLGAETRAWDVLLAKFEYILVIVDAA